MHQVGLAQADTAIEEQRVEGDRAAFGNPARGGMGQLVGLADDEAVEGEARIERRTRQFLAFPLHGRADRHGHIVGGHVDRLRPRRDIRGGRHGELQPGHRLERRHVTLDPVAVVPLHPVADEIGRYDERRDAIFQPVQLQRFNPIAIVILPDLRQQPFPHLSPRISCHFLF